MRRLSFYFSILLLTFGVGLSFVHFKFSNTKENSIADPLEVKTNAQNIGFKQNGEIKTEKQETKFVCRNTAFLFVLNLLRSNRESREHTNGFIKSTETESCDELFKIESRVDLNNDGNQELIVRTKNSQKWNFFCGATGNCSTWILGKNGKTYKVILDEITVEEIKSIKGKSRGFQNISSRYDSGAMNHYIGIYHFNGKKYQLKKCSEEITQIDGTTVFVNKALSDCE